MTLNADSLPSESLVRLPRGPRGSLLPTLQLIRDPRTALEGWVRKYGAPFLLRAMNGPVVVTGREDLIRFIHGQDPNIYAPFAKATIDPLMGRGSILTLEGDLHRREDILSLLCSATYEDGQPITREHIHSELLTFLFAGHETTALTLTWAMYHLHRHPAVYSTLVQELDSLEDNSAGRLASAPYLKAIVQETLRVHPIVTETLRKLKTPLTLGE